MNFNRYDKTAQKQKWWQDIRIWFAALMFSFIGVFFADRLAHKYATQILIENEYFYKDFLEKRKVIRDGKFVDIDTNSVCDYGKVLYLYDYVICYHVIKNKNYTDELNGYAIRYTPPDYYFHLFKERSSLNHDAYFSAFARDYPLVTFRKNQEILELVKEK